MIYKLSADTDQFLSFDISAYDIEYILGDLFLLDQPSWAEFWQPLNAVFFDAEENGKKLAVPDITIWFGYNCLALNETAYKKLHKYLENFGELLPTKSEGIPYWIFHSTVKTGMENIDAEKSARTVDETGYVDMQSLVFDENSLVGKLVFQTEFNNYRNMYCTEEFKKLVEESDLKGLYFSTDLASVNEI